MALSTQKCLSPATQKCLPPAALQDGELWLDLQAWYPADPEKGRVPGYRFGIYCDDADAPVGRIGLRVGTARQLRYPGHIGYEVDPEFRGRRFAARSLVLLMPFAARLGIPVLWVTSKADNLASRRTLEIAGLRLVDRVEVPDTHHMHDEGFGTLLRYRKRLNHGRAA